MLKPWLLAALCAWPMSLLAQTPAEILANPPLFLQYAVKLQHWEDRAEPTHIAGPIYFVGTQGLGVWLIRSSQGLILLNAGMPGSGPEILDSVRKLGFKPEDIKLLLVCHGHIDHAGSLAYLKRATGASLAVLDTESALLSTGGKADFFYSGIAAFEFPPIDADRVFGDGEVIKLGDITLIAHHTPGHTKGATTFTMNITDAGHPYLVVFADGSGLNPGYHLVDHPSYPGIADDYRHTLAYLQSLKPDIWLTAHTENFDFDRKRALAVNEGARAWVDPDGYRQYVAKQQAAFDAELSAETPAK